MSQTSHTPLLARLRPRRLLRGRSAMLARGAARGLAWRLGFPGTTLLALTQHIGDLVAAEPMSRYLKARDGRRLAWAVRRDLEPIVRCFPAVDEVLPLDSLTEWAGVARSVGPRAVDLHVDGSWCDRHLYRLRRRDATVTRANYYGRPSLLHAFAAAAGLPPPGEWGIDLTPRVRLPPEALGAAEALGLPERFVAVHCKSNQAARDWRDGRWRELAARLPLPVVEVGLTPVCAGLANVIDACGRLDVLGTAAVIARATLFVGIDSGPAHFANALCRRGVILLGRYGPFDRYMPYSGHFAEGGADVIQFAGPVADLPVETVYAACVEALDAAAAA